MSAAAPTTPYGEAMRRVEEAIARCVAFGVDQDQAEYLTLRSIVLRIKLRRGGSKAAELAYRLADEFSVEAVGASDERDGGAAAA